MSITKQIQGEYNAAINAAGIDKVVIITGENTHVSSNIPADVEIMRRSDLGPQYFFSLWIKTIMY